MNRIEVLHCIYNVNISMHLSNEIYLKNHIVLAYEQVTPRTSTSKNISISPARPKEVHLPGCFRVVHAMLATVAPLMVISGLLEPIGFTPIESRKYIEHYCAEISSRIKPVGHNALCTCRGKPFK